jgi:hypothetical protein
MQRMIIIAVASAHLLVFGSLGTGMAGCWSNVEKCDPPSTWWTCHETWKSTLTSSADPPQCDRGTVLVCISPQDNVSATTATTKAQAKASDKFGNPPAGMAIAFIDCHQGADPGVTPVAPPLNPQSPPPACSLAVTTVDGGSSCQAIVSNPGAAACLQCAAGPCCMAYDVALTADPGDTDAALQCWAQHSLDQSVSCSPPPASAGKVASFNACMFEGCLAQCDGNPYAGDAGP